MVGTNKKDLLLYFYNKDKKKLTTFTLTKMIEYLYETNALNREKDHIFINRNDIPRHILLKKKWGIDLDLEADIYMDKESGRA